MPGIQSTNVILTFERLALEWEYDAASMKQKRPIENYSARAHQFVASSAGAALNVCAERSHTRAPAK